MKLKKPTITGGGLYVLKSTCESDLFNRFVYISSPPRICSPGGCHRFSAPNIRDGLSAVGAAHAVGHGVGEGQCAIALSPDGLGRGQNKLVSTRWQDDVFVAYRRVIRTIAIQQIDGR